MTSGAYVSQGGTLTLAWVLCATEVMAGVKPAPVDDARVAGG